jgi:chemotaxis protein MotB
MQKTRPKRGDDNEGGSANWLTTFNDLVTLLMVFFVLLFTMSSVNIRDIKQFQYSLQAGLGVLEEGARVPVSVTQPPPAETQPEKTAQTQKEEKTPGTLETEISKLDELSGIDARITEQDIRLSLENRILFRTGQADVSRGGINLLQKVADVLQQLPNQIRVEGHTDNVPINTARFPSNWELSIARSVNVVRFFTEKAGIQAKRLSAVGYGELRPIATNETEAGRQRNRRVELVIQREGKV